MLVALGVLFSFATAAASAGVPPLFAKVPAGGESGSGAGRLSWPRDIAAASGLPGDVYVADSENDRIDEFDPYGDFVRAWGWGVKDGTAELQTCTEESGCRQGIAGSGAGQFDVPEAIAADNSGNVYVVDEVNRRVQKFSAEGAFLLMFGREVDLTTGGDICTAASGDQCGPGVGGTGPGQLSSGHTSYARKLDASPTGATVYLGDQGRIQEWDAIGTYKGEVPFAAIHAEEPAFPEAAGASALAVSPASGNIYLVVHTSGPPSGPVYELTPNGESTGTTFDTERPAGIAVALSGDLYIAETQDLFQAQNTPRITHYSPSGEAEEPFDVVEEEEGSAILGITVDDACGSEDIYAAHFLPQTIPTGSYIKIFGPAPDPALCAPAQAAPTVSAQYALSVSTNAASLGALINPHREVDATYYLEYGIRPCTEGGCQAVPVPPGLSLTTAATSEPVSTAPIALTGLAAGTTYHYRFVAQSSGGGPVYGTDPDGPGGAGEASFAEGGESTFTTFREATTESCPNDLYRTGLSAQLPDCRAYEMVSPVDKEGGDIVALDGTATNAPSVLDQSEPLGGKIAYGASRAFAGSESSPYTAEYVAARTSAGWSTHPVSPPRTQSLFFPADSTYAEFKLFSPDLCDGWMVSLAEPPLAAGAPPGFSDIYRRHDEQCGGPRSYEPLNTAEPADKAEFEVQGVAKDGSVTAFTSTRALTPEATEGQVQLYAAGGGVERFACVLPGGAPWTGECSAGSAEIEPGNPSAAGLFDGALSATGSSLVWTAGLGEGPIYLRKNPASTKLECSGAAAPCSVAVSHAGEEASGTTTSHYWAASADGARVIYTTGTLQSGQADLYEFEVAGAATRKIAGEVRGVMGASADARRIYLVSQEDLDGSGPAAAGRPNLYFYEAGGFKFIGVLGGDDLAPSGVAITPLQVSPQRHVARVSPDGLHAAFQASAPLTGYDNTDAVSGDADTEAYLYDAVTGRLVCVSCNPSGVRPHGGTAVQGNTIYQAAGLIPPYENSLYAADVLEGNGDRLLFESLDALVPRDTNGQRDVYEWEAAGFGGCATTAASYSQTAGGCIDLISSGTSPGPARIADVSASGDDVFFTTLASLVPGDPGQVDLYDARVDGGFASAVAPSECQGEACQSAAPAPREQSPSSSSYRGPGKLHPGCKRSKKGHKRRCVHRPKHHRHRHTHRKHGSKKARKNGRGR